MSKSFYIKLIIIFLIASCGGKDDYIIPDDIITIDPLKIDRKVLVIGIDGFRSDAMQETFTPFMYNLSQKNNVYFNSTHIVEGITYSGPNWSSILTGVHMNKHNVTDNSFDNHNYAQYPPFFHYMETINEDIYTASIVNWIPINAYIASDYTDYASLDPIDDAMVFESAKQMLLDSNVDVLFLQFDESDGAGHAHGFSPLIEAYTDTLNSLDTYSQALFEIIENKRANGEDWLFMIVSDHGGEGTSHGDANDPNINQTIFFAQHPELTFKANCCYISSQADLAPTILDFIGISSTQFSNNTDGNTIIN